MSAPDQHPAAPETEHTPVDVYEMPDESAESLHARIEAGTAVLAFRVCEECAPAEVLERIEDGDLDLSDGEALAAQWPCEFVTPAAPETDVSALVRAGLRKCRVDDGAPVALIREGDLFHITHMVVADLAPLLADLTVTRERLRVVEGERDAWEAEAEASAVAAGNAYTYRVRAESAEADRDALRAGIEALADDMERGRWPSRPRGGVVDDLRALLAGGDR